MKAVVDGNTSKLNWISNSAWKIGIGTTTPSAKLHVVTNWTSLDQDTSSEATLLLKWNTASDATGIRFSWKMSHTTLMWLMPDSDDLVIRTDYGWAWDSSQEKVRITGAGNVWIWASSPLAKLDIRGNLFMNASWKVLNIAPVTDWMQIWTAGYSQPLIFSTTNSEKMRITPWGNIGIWNTTPQNTLHVTGGITVWNTAIGDKHLAFTNESIQASSLWVWYTPLTLNPLWWSVNVWSDSVADWSRALFAKWYWYAALNVYRYADDWNTLNFHRNGTWVWSVSVNSSSTQFNTTSDYRLKENIEPLTSAIERLNNLKPVRYNFKTDPENTVDWFIAHEVGEVIPEAVSWEKDWVDAEGNPEYQGMDYWKVTPLLTAALQEALEKIEKLEERIKVLENK